jgi:hypothetical protein
MPKKIDDSIEVFYKELLDTIYRDTFENSYAEFSYEFKTRTKLFDEIQRYIQDASNPFYESFVEQNAIHNIQIKGLKFIECYTNSIPTRGGKYTEKFIVKFTILYVRKITNA